MTRFCLGRTSLFALFFMLIALPVQHAKAWGFLAHRRINHLAVYTLPLPLRAFYLQHQSYVTEAAPNPDKRRSSDPTEAHKHYIDLDVKRYTADSFLIKNRPVWAAAVARYSEDTLNEYGTVPWQVRLTCAKLTEAFKSKNWEKVLFYSADLGHYAADANVPLHTSENYDGQMSGQRGIHALWESRLPEQFFKDYVFLPGKADYQADVNARAWANVLETHRALDSVLTFERKVSAQIPVAEKTTVTEKGNRITRTYTQEFSAAYHQALGTQVERRMDASIKLVGDLWYTCWMDAGQPDLPTEMGPEPSPNPEPAPQEKGTKIPIKREEE
jgi:hypothetical protein